MWQITTYHLIYTDAMHSLFSVTSDRPHQIRTYCDTRWHNTLGKSTLPDCCWRYKTQTYGDAGIQPFRIEVNPNRSILTVTSKIKYENTLASTNVSSVIWNLNPRSSEGNYKNRYHAAVIASTPTATAKLANIQVASHSHWDVYFMVSDSK